MAGLSKKVAITCAVTGGIHTPTMSDALPFTPEDIARQSIEAAEAGAAILHLHARGLKDDHPTPDPAVFMQFLPRMANQALEDEVAWSQCLEIAGN